jgi:hypothetical protein
VAGRKQKRVVGFETLLLAVEHVGELAKSSGVDVALVGGVALQLYGSDRLTADVDFAAYGRIRGLKRGTSLSFGGEQTSVEVAGQEIDVDIIRRKDEFRAVYDEAVAYARKLPESPVPVASPEHLVVMKMVSGRPKDELDLDFLIASGAAEDKRVKRILKRLLGPYAVVDYERAVDVARWRASKDKSKE